MANSRNSHTDVLVVGAGPVGLMMAGELARHGIKPRIIEKAPAPSDKSKAFGIHARTMEIFENLGIVERFLKEGNICNGLNFYDEGKELAEIDLSHIESKYPFVLILAQSITERLLAEHLYSFGIEVERDEDRCRKRRRKVAYDAGERVDSAERRADDDDVALGAGTHLFFERHG